MTETKNPGEKTLSVAPTKTLTLKRGVEQGVVRQSFSHGRTKPVVVEKVKRRVVGPGEAKVEVQPGTLRLGAKATPVPSAAPPAPSSASQKPSGVVLRSLTEEERSKRAHALADATLREALERKEAEEEARRRAEREGRERIEREAAEARKREEDERRRHEEETKRKAEQEAQKRFGGEEAKVKPLIPPAARPPLVPDEDEAPRTIRRGPGPAR